MPLVQNFTKASSKLAAKTGIACVSKPKPASKVLTTEAHTTPKRRVRPAKNDTRPAVTEMEPVTIGHGEYAISMRHFVQNRQTFVGETVSKTPFSREYVQMRTDEIEDGSYKRIDQDSILVETKDGFGLVMVVKKGMWAGKSGMEAELQEQSETAFKEFAEAYPPETPRETDYRHRVSLETEMKEWVDKGLPWGRLLRFSGPNS